MNISRFVQRCDMTACIGAADYTPSRGGCRDSRRFYKEGSMRNLSSASRFALILCIAVSVSVVAHAHTYIGWLDPVNARARVQSPNANVADFPVPIPDTNLSVVCFKVRNTSPFDSRITAIGFDVPGSETGYSLIAPADSGFQLIEQVANVPELHDTVLDFALVTGRTFGGGQPGAGLAPSATLTTFCVSGPFPRDLPIERLIDTGVLRMQRVGADGEAGDILVWENRPR
jgi:hypothetical protein